MNPPPPRKLSSLDTPALCLDRRALGQNLATMAELCRAHGKRLRPHIKTHKCVEIARLQLDAGAIGVTCATLNEAEAMAAAGIDHILIANQVVGERAVRRLVQLAQRADVMALVDHPQQVAPFAGAAAAAGVELPLLVEVNIGLNRCRLSRDEDVVALARLVDRSPGLRFAGLQGYEGLILDADADRRRARVAPMVDRLRHAYEAVMAGVGHCAIVTTGGTSVIESLLAEPCVTEVQPGSYALMDASFIGVRGEFAQAVSVMGTVLSRHGNRVVLDAGHKAVADDNAPARVMGLPGAAIVALNEEHAILDVAADDPVAIGDRVGLMPGHCCQTTKLHDRWHLCDGDDVVAVWPVVARGWSAERVSDR